MAQRHWRSFFRKPFRGVPHGDACLAVGVLEPVHTHMQCEGRAALADLRRCRDRARYAEEDGRHKRAEQPPLAYGAGSRVEIGDREHISVCRADYTEAGRPNRWSYRLDRQICL